MLARGEASPAVSINEPSLEAALISRCTGAVLFTTVASLTLLNPNGFWFRRGSTTEVQRYNVKLLYVLLVEELENNYLCCLYLEEEFITLIEG